jgi:O-antigen ligase
MTTALSWLLSLVAVACIATPASRLHWGPGYMLLLILLGATVGVATAARRAARPGQRLRPLQRLALGYVALVVVAAVAHGSALATLAPSHVVAVGGTTAAAALQALLEETPLHLGLPLALFASSVLIELRPSESWRRFRLLPLLLLPSATVALIQGGGRIELWNVSHFVLHGRASGLAYDANSLAACILLLLPLALLSTATADSRPARVGSGLLSTLLLVALAATGNRTALVGVAALLPLLTLTLMAIAPPGDRWRRARLVLAPVAVAAATITLFALTSRGAQQPVGLVRLNQALDRLRTEGAGAVFESSWRGDLWRQAARIWASAPVAGVGPGGFIRELSNARFRGNDSSAAAPIDHAASHYLQIAAELGTIGLLLQLALLLAPTWRVARAARRRAEDEDRSLATTLVCTLGVALPLLQFNHYGLFPDVAWALALLLAFADATAAREVDGRRRGGRSRQIAAAAILALFAAASVSAAFGRHGYEARATAGWWPFRFDSGCYAVESWDGIPTRWCGPEAWLPVPVRWPGDSALALQSIAHHPDLAARPLEVRIGLVDGSFRTLHFDRPEWRRLSIPIAPSALVPCFDGAGSRATCLAVRLETSRGWRPSEWSASADDRWLGIAVRAQPVPDLSLLPGHLFSDDFEAGDLARWRLGEESGDEL